MSNSQHDASDYVRRMEELRSMGRRDVKRMFHEVERVADWREHVRSRPLMSTLAAVAVGYIMVKSVTSRPAKTYPEQKAPPINASTFQRTSASSGLLALMGGVATNVARQWAMEFVKRQLKVSKHDNPAQPSSIQR